MADNGLRESIPIESSLIFSHPRIKKDLVIKSGAHSINWSYELNTSSTPTVGGEVVQILSCFVGPMTIVGEAGGMRPDRDPRLPTGWGSYTPTDEMEHIIGWFLNYMELAGTIKGSRERRNETAVRFMYPARNWDFLIAPIDLQGFDISWDQTTLPWSITAEVVSDKALDYFVASTMNTFTDSLVNRKLLQAAISPGKDYINNPFINPSFNNLNMDNYAKQIGNNFQSLIAAWTTGDFMTWGYNPMGDNANLSNDPYDLYGQTFGGWFVGEKTDFTDWSTEFSDVQGGSGSITLPGLSTDSISGELMKKFITCGSRDRNLDPAAVLAVAQGEGGFSGAVGDTSITPGQSFSVGPFQLYYNPSPPPGGTSGALPKSIGQKGQTEASRWANSPEGINYALDKIASVAAGQTGNQAIDDIVRKFERPADPAGSIAKAQSRLKTWQAYVATVDCSAEVIATPGSYQALLEACQLISDHTKGYSPYSDGRVGSGHGQNLDTYDFANYFDCSASTSKVLRAAGMFDGTYAINSGSFASSWGDPGEGQFFTVWANSGHVFIQLKNASHWRLDTGGSSASDSRPGPRLRNTSRSTVGFTPRHWPGM